LLGTVLNIKMLQAMHVIINDVDSRDHPARGELVHGECAGRKKETR